MAFYVTDNTYIYMLSLKQNIHNRVDLDVVVLTKQAYNHSWSSRGISCQLAPLHDNPV